jgi:hypothetical protein
MSVNNARPRPAPKRHVFGTGGGYAGAPAYHSRAGDAVWSAHGCSDGA